MAKIHLSIEADGVSDLSDTLSSLMYLSAYRTDDPVAALVRSGEIVPAEQEQEPIRPQAEAPKKRGRPPKAQEPTPEPAPQSGIPDQTDVGDPSDLEAALMEGAAEEPASEITAQDVMSAMHAHIEKHGAPNTLPVLEKHGAGAKSFKQIQPEHYAAVHAALSAGL